MSLIVRPTARIFVYSEAIDMRAGFGKLQALVAEKMKANLFEGNLFLFLGRNPRRAKLLVFDGTGLLLIAKRLDRGAFMPVQDLCETNEITQEELARLLDGANLRVVFAAKKSEHWCRSRLNILDDRKKKFIIGFADVRPAKLAMASK